MYFYPTTNYSKQRISICHKNSFSKRSWRLISRPWLEFSWQQLCNVFCVPGRLSKSEKTTLMRSWAKTYLRFNLLSQIMFIFIVHSTIINQTGVLLLLFEACVTNWREVLNYSTMPVLVVLQQGTSTVCTGCVLLFLQVLYSLAGKKDNTNTTLNPLYKIFIFFFLNDIQQGTRKTKRESHLIQARMQFKNI